MSSCSALNEFSVDIRGLDYAVMRIFVTSMSRDVLECLNTITELPVLSRFAGLVTDTISINCSVDRIKVDFIDANGRNSLTVAHGPLSTDIPVLERRFNPRKLCIRDVTSEGVEFPSGFENIMHFNFSELSITGFEAPLVALRPFLASASTLTISNLKITDQFSFPDFLNDIKHVRTLDLGFANRIIDNDDLRGLIVNPSKKLACLNLYNVTRNISYDIVDAVSMSRIHLVIYINGRLSSGMLNRLDELDIFYRERIDLNTESIVTDMHWSPLIT